MFDDHDHDDEEEGMLVEARLLGVEEEMVVHAVFGAAHLRLRAVALQTHQGLGGTYTELHLYPPSPFSFSLCPTHDLCLV